MSTSRGGKGGGERGRGRGNTGIQRVGARACSRSNSPAHSGSEQSMQAVYTPKGSSQRARGTSQRGASSTRGSFSARGSTRGRGSHVNLHITNDTQHAAQSSSEDYKNRLDRIRAVRPAQRRHFIEQGLMNPEEFERVRRIVENDVKAPECTPKTEHLPRAQRIPDESRMVKAYARSAAGMDVELVSEMRSPTTCLKTTDYLFDRLDHDEFSYLQNFIWDRTRAIRKDLRTQRIETKPDINILLTCLERTARFHLLSMHHMARAMKHDYTHQQDLEQLNQTMMSLRERYTDNRRATIPSENEAEFWAYRFILAPQYATHQLEDEMHRLPSHIRNNVRVRTAIEIFQLLKSVLITESKSFVQCQANWKKLWALIKSSKVSYLMACAAEVSFNRVRHVVLDCIWRAFRVGNAKRLVVVEDWTPDKLKDVLGLDTEKEAVQLCEDFGFEFSLDAAGQTFLDITKKGYANQVLSKPAVDNPQTFSASLVEFKRHDRALSAVIHGMPVQVARTSGWIVNEESSSHMVKSIEDESSLFVPEVATTPGDIFSWQVNTKSDLIIQKTTSILNPFPDPFQPQSQFSASSNPFFEGTTGGQPAPPPSRKLGGESTEPNPFLQNVALTQFTPTPSFFPKANATTAAPNPFLQNKDSASLTLASPLTNPAAPAPPVTVLSTSKSTKNPFTFPDLKGSQNAVLSNSQSNSHNSLYQSPSGDIATTQRAAREKAEGERLEIVQKEKAIARQRVQEARIAQEAEQRRMEQERVDREREVIEERERFAREAEERQAKEEQNRRARVRDLTSAWQSLTTDIVFHSEEGLMLQFVENAVLNIAQAVMIEEQQKREEREIRTRRRNQLARVVIVHWVAVIQKRRRIEQTRTRRKRIKEQRAYLSNLIDGNMDTTSNITASVSASAPLTADVAPSHQNLITSNRCARRTDEHRQGQPSPHAVRSGPCALRQAFLQKATQTDIDYLTSSNRHTSTAHYSYIYHQSTGPVDRTETDWFELRAMGVDPSKQRKRSFDSTSSEEDEKSTEPKRTKLTPLLDEELVISRSAQPTAEDPMSRFRAIQQAFRKSVSSPPQSIHGARSTMERFSFEGSTNLPLLERARDVTKSSAHRDYAAQPGIRAASFNKSSFSPGDGVHLIAKARKFVTHSSAASRSPPNRQHDWGRNVSNLGYASSTSSRSALERSTAPSDHSELRAAYWGRASRFVPHQLYGRGPEVIRAYNIQHSKRTQSANSHSAGATHSALSSPDYPQQGNMQEKSALGNPAYNELAGEISGAQDVSEEEDYGHQQYTNFSHSNRYHQQPENSESEESDVADVEEGSNIGSETESENELQPDLYGNINDYNRMIHTTHYNHVAEEEVLEDYDEYSGGEDDEDLSHLPYAVYCPNKTVLQQPLEQAGTTEDDAIELSD